jgi:hypothetical protein
MHNRNNLILILVLTLLAFICAFPLQWFTLANATTSDGQNIPSLVVNGNNGSIGLFNLWMPIWLLLAISGAGLIVGFANLAGITTLPRLLPILLLLIPGAYYVTVVIPMWHMDKPGQQLIPSIGVLLAIVATLVAVTVTMLSPRPGLHEVPRRGLAE